MGELKDSSEIYDSESESDGTDKSDEERNGSNLSPIKRKLDNENNVQTKKVKLDKSKYKQPTSEELNNFREVENLYNSYILKSELEDLIASNTFKDSKRTEKCNKFDKWFTELVTALNSMPEHENIKPSEFIKMRDKGKKKMRSVQLLINDTNEFAEAYTLCDGSTVSSFVRPESVHVFGGFKLGGACLKSDFIPKILVKMPASAFYEKDFLNNRYWVKRFHYLLYLLYELKHKPFINQIEVGNYQNNELLKILRITPSYDTNVRIQLFVVPEMDTFKTSRMEPNQNNFKVNVFGGMDLKSRNFSGVLFNNMDISCFVRKGTAIYNTHLLHDFTLENNNKNIEKILLEYTSCQDAIKLLILWLQKRQLNQNYTSFTNELLIYTIVYLIQKKKINKHMSSYQVVRIFLIFINDSDWRVKPISLSSATEFAAFTENFDVVFTDYSGHYNLAGFLHKDIYGKLKLEAAMALEILNEDVFRAFMSLFKANMAESLQYDCIVYFNDIDSFKTIYNDFTSDDIKWKYFGFYEQLITNQLLIFLKYGLGERVQYIVPLYLKPKHCLTPTNKKVTTVTEGHLQKIVFGLKLNPATALHPLIIGPQQYDPEAAKFKEFWGDLVSLRRFANTSIHESVFFDQAKTVADKRNICAKIVEFIANKMNISFEMVSNQFEEVLTLPHMELPFKHGTNEEATKLVLVTMDELFKKLRELTLSNVSIQMVQCVSDVLCGTDPFPPIATNYNSGKKLTTVKGRTIHLRELKNVTLAPKFVPLTECIMQINLLDKTAFDSLVLYNASITSIYHAISVALNTSDPNILAKPSLHHVDVLFKGLVFRLRAFNDREVALLKKSVDDNGQVIYRTNPESVDAERKGHVEGAVYGALNGLYRKFPCYGTATAIAKRWLRSQLLHQGHINDMTVNLLMAAVFLSPKPFDRPTLPQMAFLHFLRLLAEFPFDQLPVVLNFNGELNKDNISRVESEFVEKRDHYNTLHILMLYDHEKSLFTLKSPDNMIIRRLKHMAIDSLRSVNECINEQERIFPEFFFVPNMEGYNVIIHLYSTLNPKRHLKVLHKTENPITIVAYDENEETKFPIVAYSPVDIYLNKLEESFGKYAYFFQDIYGGNFIGVIWNIRACETKPFKISKVSGRNFVNGNICFDIEAALQDFVTLGGGLVKDIIENNNVDT